MTAESKSTTSVAKCPACKNALPDGAPRCPSCKFNLRAADVKFGALPRQSAYLTDRARCLPLQELELLRDELALFHRRFPQVPFSVFLVDLLPGQSATEYAFWLANRAPSGTVHETGSASHSLLLLIDPHGGAAVFAAGYGLECMLSEDELQGALTVILPALNSRAFAPALHLAIENITTLLRDEALRQTTSPNDET
ncbi:MAG: hypothetical protein M3R59_10510 [Verrucomicrobiota bacterium]|nr:hypothetical protein [Verrucomicrobiota bacterium]